MVHVEETITNRRLAGFFIRNTEHAQRVFNTIKAAPLPTTGQPAAERQRRDGGQGQQVQGQGQGQQRGNQQNGPGGKGPVWQAKPRTRVAA